MVESLFQQQFSDYISMCTVVPNLEISSLKCCLNNDYTASGVPKINLMGQRMIKNISVTENCFSFYNLSVIFYCFPVKY